MSMFINSVFIFGSALKIGWSKDMGADLYCEKLNKGDEFYHFRDCYNPDGLFFALRDHSEVAYELFGIEEHGRCPGPEDFSMVGVPLNKVDELTDEDLTPKPIVKNKKLQGPDGLDFNEVKDERFGKTMMQMLVESFKDNPWFCIYDKYKEWFDEEGYMTPGGVLQFRHMLMTIVPDFVEKNADKFSKKDMQKYAYGIMELAKFLDNAVRLKSRIRWNI